MGLWPFSIQTRKGASPKTFLRSDNTHTQHPFGLRGLHCKAALQLSSKPVTLGPPVPLGAAASPKSEPDEAAEPEAKLIL